MMHFRSFSHCSLPITSPPSAVNFTAISSSVIGSRGSPFGTSTRVECDLPSLVDDGHATRLELGKERFELFVRDYFYLVHDWNQRLIQHAFLFELQGCYHSVHQPDGHAIGQRMIGGFLRVGSILVRIAKNISGARDHFDLNFLYLVGFELVFLYGLHHGRERRVTERFDRKTFHAAIQDPVVRFRVMSADP